MVFATKWVLLMNDFDYDCLQRKNISRQAKYRKRGSKSKKCSMPTDNMTLKQWRERNGELVTISLNQPVSWETFKTLSRRTQEEYLQNLMMTYGANATSLAGMFGVKPLTVRRFVQANELDVKFHVGRSMSAEQRAAWESFINVNIPDIIDTKPPESSSGGFIEKESGNKMYMREVYLSFDGQIDIPAIANSLTQVLGSNASGEIKIICSLCLKT